jgi:hypothetical protein
MLKHIFAGLTDRRYDNLEFQRFSTSTANDQDFYKFTLPPLSGVKMYQISDIYIQIGTKIVDANGAPPLKGEKVAPINNVLHSCFSEFWMDMNCVVS